MEPTVSTVVGEQVAGQGKIWRKKAETIINAMESNQFDLGLLLAQIQDAGSYTSWGFSTYTEWIASTKLKPSKGRYLPQIARCMQKLGIAREEYEKVGISKLRVIAALNPDDVYVHPISKDETSMGVYIRAMVEKAIEEGEGYPLTEVKKNVRTLQGKVGDRDITYRGFPILRIANDSVVTPAFDRIAALIGSVGTDEDGNAIRPSDGVILERMAAVILLLKDEDIIGPTTDTGMEEDDGEGYGEEQAGDGTGDYAGSGHASGGDASGDNEPGPIGVD